MRDSHARDCLLAVPWKELTAIIEFARQSSATTEELIAICCRYIQYHRLLHDDSGNNGFHNHSNEAPLDEAAKVIAQKELWNAIPWEAVGRSGEWDDISGVDLLEESELETMISVATEKQRQFNVSRWSSPRKRTGRK